MRGHPGLCRDRTSSTAATPTSGRGTKRPGWRPVCIAATYGEDALDDFYRRADADGGTDRAFRELGTTERAFTAAWRDELETLAR